MEKRGLSYAWKAEDVSGSGRIRMHFLVWEQGDASINLTPPPTPLSIGHLVLRGLNKVHKYFTFMT